MVLLDRELLTRNGNASAIPTAVVTNQTRQYHWVCYQIQQPIAQALLAFGIQQLGKVAETGNRDAVKSTSS